MTHLQDKKATVLGLGKSGVSAAEFLVKHGARVVLSEGSSADPQKALEAERLRSLGIRVEIGEHSEEALNFADFFVVSPGIPPGAEVIRRIQQRGKEIICDIELAYRYCKTPMIAVTGTNGKSTTCALISHILQAAGHSAPACGNFGVPILDEVDRLHKYLVVETSSYQLNYSKDFAPQIGVWLNLTPDHLDWHGSLDAYIQAKEKLFLNQKANHFAVINMDDPIVSRVGNHTQAEIFPFSATRPLEQVIQGAFVRDGFLIYRIDGRTRMLCRAEELKIIGQHNLENVLAAVCAATAAGVKEEQIKEAIKSFSALEHRLEYVAEVEGVRFYNDSKATNPNSAVKALEAFGSDRPVIILGGKDKGTPLDDLVLAVRKHAAAVILIGQAKERFRDALNASGYLSIQEADTLEEAVELGASLKRGPVLLSPACASFDMFKNYEERGRVFKNCVHKRQQRAGASR